MANLIVILGDQLSKNIASLENADKNKDVILICEVMKEATYVKHHKKKIVFIFAAMRHFAQGLKKAGYNVHYSKIDDKDNAGSFSTEVEKICKRNKFDKIVITYPGEYRVLSEIKTWKKNFNIEVEIREDNRFLCSISDFKEWSEDRKTLRMEYFYRMMRKKYNILMEGKDPAGGKWNFDKQNRAYPSKEVKIPSRNINKKDSITEEVINVVSLKFKDHFGDIEPFYLAVTREDAVDELTDFIDNRLIYFGDYQDAMISGEPFMFHANISAYLNIGLLDPMECIKAAEHAYFTKDLPINCVEGFIRQILGWREYVRGIYWLKMPEYKSLNYFNAKRPLPDFFWSGDVKMNCLKQCITETKENAYAHHIQRLMVLGNFTMLCGINPDYVNEWYLIVYADAYEWVELPNVSGMALFADGGVLASKPYISSGSYINKMSNYCKSCEYKVSKKSGKDACPFNYLFWNFLIEHHAKLSKNQRLTMMYKIFGKMDESKVDLIKQDSNSFLKKLY